MKENCAFEAYITNLGKYNEGVLIGEWVGFPATTDEMKDVLDRIGINEQYEELFITDYAMPIRGMHGALGEYESLDELNYLAYKIDDMQDYQRDIFEAAIELGDYASSAKDLINLTENLDNYDLLPGVQDDSDLGYYWIEESGIYDLSNMGNLASYFDYEKFGRDIQLDEYGTYTDSGYVRRTGDDFYEEYDGDFDNIPDEYRLTAENNVLSISPKSHETEKQSQGRILDNPGSYSIYQLKGGDNLHYYRFASYDELKNAGLTVDCKNYNEVYSAELPKHFTADDIFMKFNLYPPPEFEGHSLSVSDVIVMRKNGTEKALYVDIAGYKEIRSF